MLNQNVGILLLFILILHGSSNGDFVPISFINSVRKALYINDCQIWINQCQNIIDLHAFMTEMFKNKIMCNIAISKKLGCNSIFFGNDLPSINNTLRAKGLFIFKNAFEPYEEFECIKINHEVWFFNISSGELYEEYMIPMNPTPIRHSLHLNFAVVNR